MSSWSALDRQRAELEERLRKDQEKESSAFQRYLEARAKHERTKKLAELNRQRNHAKFVEEFDKQTERIEVRIREEGLSEQERLDADEVARFDREMEALLSAPAAEASSSQGS